MLYRFKGLLHEVVVADNHPLTIPLMRDKLPGALGSPLVPSLSFSDAFRWWGGRIEGRHEGGAAAKG